MDNLRKLHNNCKRRHILDWVSRGDFTLDCGCGRGGDLQKWKAAGARVAFIDPDEESLIEAQKRASEMKMDVFFLGKGTIVQAAFAGPFDVVCYNFSIHYIFDSLEQSIKALGVAVRPGGHLIGITPDMYRAEAMADIRGHFEDELGNEFNVYSGGRRLMVRLADGPFYADGPRDEPLLNPRILINLLLPDFDLVQWESMLPEPNGLISDIYSKFVFRRKNISV